MSHTPNHPSLVGAFADFAHDAFRRGLDDDVRYVASRQLLDSVAVSLAAIGEDTVRSVEQLVGSWRSQGEARRLGNDARLPAAHAALIGGTLAHALDFDDTHFPSVLHPSASVIPSVLAVADQLGSGLDAALDAIALGNDLVVRLGMAGYDEDLGNSIFFERGFHATSICGAVGSALATGLLRGLGPEGLAHAMGIASSFGAGLLEANRAGGTVKRMHCGWAAHGGTSASELAALGVTGPPSVFEGRFGFLQAFCGDGARPDRVTEGLGEFSDLTAIGFKPYPTNAFTHSVIDAALELRALGVHIDAVTSAMIRLPQPVLRTVAEPPEEKARPATPYGARFSAPFVFALALRGQSRLGVVMEDFSPASIQDPSLLRLAGVTAVTSTPELNAAYPASVPTVVTVELADGSNRHVEIRHPLGTAGRPLPDDLLQAKFLSCVDGVLEPERAAEVLSLVTQRPWDGHASRIMDLTGERMGERRPDR